jgi:hypothetical protein
MSASGKFGVGLVASLALAGGAMGQIDCSAGCANPATVDNGAFSVEFLGAVEQAPYITFAYTVCQLDTGALPRFQPELSHWNLGLAQIDCFLEGKGMVDLVVGATLDGAPTVFDVNTDPTTGVTGIKWDEGVDDRGCHTWTVTFDTSVLLENFTLVPGCAIVATKAGQQVAYACGVGPICVDPPRGNVLDRRDRLVGGHAVRHPRQLGDVHPLHRRDDRGHALRGPDHARGHGHLRSRARHHGRDLRYARSRVPLRSGHRREPEDPGIRDGAVG